jgi:iron complex transport system ATP-binding protein
MSRALETRRLTVERGGVPVVCDLNLEAASGEWLGLIGPNGAGKTTVLKVIAGLVPYSGQILVEGGDIARLGRRSLARRVALVPQSPVIPPLLTVGEYVLLGRTPHLSYLGRESRSDHDAVARAMGRLDLDDLADRMLCELSGGERQRAVLARALAQDAALLLLDEPTTALDIGRQQSVLELVDCVRRELGLTVVAAMHDLTLAGQYAGRLVLLSHGLLAAEGRPDEVLTDWRISEHYRARVEILGGAMPAVVPRRKVHGPEVAWRR